MCLRTPKQECLKKHAIHVYIYIIIILYLYCIYDKNILYFIYIILYYTISYVVTLQYIILYHIILYYYILYHITLYYIYHIHILCIWYIYVYIDSLFIVDDKEIPVRNAWPGEAPLSICPKGSRLAMAMRSPLHPGTKITTWVCLKIVYP